MSNAPSVPPITVIVVGTHPPTHCGLATYTAHVCRALQVSGVDARVLRLLGPDEGVGLPTGDVIATWRRGTPYGLAAAVRATHDADAVLLQHEFGIYPGPDGAEVLDFLEGCRRPVVSVLHTVLDDPSPAQRTIVERIGSRSSHLVVHGTAAEARLISRHDIDPTKVIVIPHGATTSPPGPSHITLARPMMLTWGLLGPGKGIEHGIAAVSHLRRQGIDLRYTVAGETHPNVRAACGETYRDGLRTLADSLDVADLVEFDDRYRDWPAQLALARSASFVLLPYDTRDQVTSGVLVEALAAGRPVIATAFPHALELAATGAVVVVPHEAPDRIAVAAARIIREPGLRHTMETAARAEGARYDWKVVGARYAAVLASAARSAVVGISGA